MEFKLGYHKRTKVFKYMQNNAIKELIELVQSMDYPPEESRKSLGGIRSTGMRDVVKKTFNDSLTGSWDHQVRIFDDTLIPGTAMHYAKNRIGIIRSLQHRTSIGTDILRLEIAYRVQDSIDIGVFVCGTRNFEEYYLGTEKKKSEQMITLEQIELYLEMIEDIISVPILIIGLNPPLLES